MKIIVLVLLLVSCTCYGQQDSVKYKAGMELIRFSRIHTIGASLEIAGVGLALLSTATIKNGTIENNTAAIASAGAILSFVGYIVEATSYKHIKRAGIIFMGNGVALPVKYGKKHRG